MTVDAPRRLTTASITTLGCKLNQAESYRLQIELAKAGVDLLPFGEAVDLSIVNTCTVTHTADQQARQLLRRAHRASPGGYVVAMGCYAQVAPQEVRAVEGVDLVVASDKERLVQQLEAFGFELGDGHDNPDGGSAGPDNRVPLPASRVRQFVKVQDGCDDYCTYCIVPIARGHSASRPSGDIVDDVCAMVARGCREIVLTGVQIGAYGRDRYALRGHELPPPGAPLAALVRRLLAETSIERIRISSIQPQDWPDDFLDLFGDRRLCAHLHLPLQSGSDATLRRMARRYTTADFARLAHRVRDGIPEVALTADMIVGFPGESESDHADSVAFARSMAFADVHVFRYSPRRGTAAARMAQHVSPEMKRRRSEELRTVVDEMAAAFRRRFVGSTRRVLWEEGLPLSPALPRKGGGGLTRRTPMPSPQPSPRGRGTSAWKGLTDNYLRVETESQHDLLGVTSAVLLATLDGETFRVGPVAGSAANTPGPSVTSTTEGWGRSPHQIGAGGWE